MAKKEKIVWRDESIVKRINTLLGTNFSTLDYMEWCKDPDTEDVKEKIYTRFNEAVRSLFYKYCSKTPTGIYPWDVIDSFGWVDDALAYLLGVEKRRIINITDLGIKPITKQQYIKAGIENGTIDRDNTKALTELI